MNFTADIAITWYDNIKGINPSLPTANLFSFDLVSFAIITLNTKAIK